MKIKSFLPDYLTALKYLALFIVFVLFNKIEGVILPYSVAVYVWAISFKFSKISTPVLFLCSFLVLGETGLLLSVSIPTVFFIVIESIYNSLNLKRRLEYFLYTALTMLGFIFIGNTNYNILMEKRIFVCVFSSILTIICQYGLSPVFQKGLKFKFTSYEYSCLFVIFGVLGLGICHTLTPLVFNAIAFFIILFCSYLFRTGNTSIISSVISLPLAIYYGKIEYVGMFLIIALCSQGFMSISRYISCIVVLLAEFILQTIFNVYEDYFVWQFLSSLTGATCFFVIPTRFIKKLKEKLYSFREKQLVRQTINQNRLLLSNRLYEISGVFSEMAWAFNTFKHHSVNEDTAKNSLLSKLRTQICTPCSTCSHCKLTHGWLFSELSKLIGIGFAKGKISLIDLPKSLADNCNHCQEIIFCVNKMMAEYRSIMLSDMNLNNGRELIANQAQGVSIVLKGLALESGSQLKYQSRIERELTTNLYIHGFNVNELLIYGDEDNLYVEH